MSTPILKWLGQTASGARFRVVREGEVDGRWYGAGSVLLCAGDARTGDAVVLVTRGIGRPRLGRMEGTALIGSSGERCHPARWSCAGRIVAIEPPQASPAPVELLPPAPPAQASPQLSLFAA